MFAVLSNWYQCAHPVFSYCHCCLWTWHTDALAICPCPDAEEQEKQDALGSFSEFPTPIPRARIHAQLGLTQPMAIVRCFVPCCEKALVALQQLTMPQKRALPRQSQWWFFTRFGRSHVDAKKLYWCHHLSKQIWNFTELRNRFCIFIGIKGDRWSKQRHPRGRYMSMQKALTEENSTLWSSSW